MSKRSEKRNQQREENKITKTLDHAYHKYVNPRRTMTVAEEKEMDKAIMQALRENPLTSNLITMKDITDAGVSNIYGSF